MNAESDTGSLEREIAARVEALENRSTAPVRAIRREYSRRLRGAKPGVVLDLALRLKEHDSFDYRVIAQELVANHPPAFACLDERLLLQFGGPLDSWWTVDSFALDLAGAAWRAKQVEDALIERWALSEDRWWRRAALVCTVPLNLKSRGGTGDTARTLHICGLLIDDRDDMVVKALSWALRVLSQQDRAAVETFLAEHEDGLAASLLGEVRSKLATGLKGPRKRLST